MEKVLPTENGLNSGTVDVNCENAASFPDGLKMPSEPFSGKQKSGAESASRKKFRVVSLHFPLDYSEQVLIELMKESQSFHLWFEREHLKTDQVKRGGLSVSFDTEEAAKEAYFKIKDKTINGVRIKIQAPSWADECSSSRPESELKTSANQPVVAEIAQNFEGLDTKRKLFVSQLLPTTDDDLIFAVFGKENLRHVDIMLDEKRKDGTKTAVLTFHTPELAEQSKHDYDGFVVDDGELSKPMKILLYSDYLNKKQSEKNRKEAKKGASSSKPTPPPAPSDNLQQPDLSPVQGSLLNEKRGKAGNLWSAQIVENRSGDVNNENLINSVITTHDNHMPIVSECSHINLSTTPKEKREHRSLSPPKTRKSEGRPASVEAPKIEKLEDSHRSGNNVQENFDSYETTQLREAEQAQFSGELSDVEISRAADSYIESNRINWAEIHSLEELWKIVDDVVKIVGWQPESTLKRGMLITLEKAESANSSDWWQRHVQFLIRMWKREVETETRSKVRKQLHLSVVTDDPSSKAPENEAIPTEQIYTPLPPSPKVKRKSGKRALMELMGVGAFLANVQTESGIDKSSPNRKERNSSRRADSRNAKRKRRASSCESGEASSTTSSSGSETGSERGARSSASAGRRKLADRKQRGPPSNRRQRHEERQQRSTSARGGGAERAELGENNASSAPANVAINQNWLAQSMPAFMQMMPMMMQMCQMRMSMGSVPAQQFQQQFQQVYQQIRAQIGGGVQPAGDTVYPPSFSAPQAAHSQQPFNPADQARLSQYFSGDGAGGSGYHRNY